jgi:hypothetical protein
MLEDPTKIRQMAAKYLRLAMAATNAASRNGLLRLASRYHELAVEIERCPSLQEESLLDR